MFPRLFAVLMTAVFLLGAPSVKAFAAVRFAVFSDPHYYDTDLGTEGTAFETYLAQDRKLIRESEALTKAVIEKIIAANAETPIDFVIVPGDLTKDGALTSHQEFAAYLKQLEDAGIAVFVAPGNHDINNPHAASYDGDVATAVDNVSAAQFAAIYADFGYREATMHDSDSLSYAVEAVPGVVLLSLDSCKYDDNLAQGSPETSGAFSQTTLAWAAGVVERAKAAGKQVVAFQHHGMTEHYTGQATAFADYVIDDHETVAGTLADAGLKIVFTGHYHANDITKTTGSTDDAVLYDIETGSLVTAPCPYRIVTLHGNNAAQIETRHITDIDYDYNAGLDDEEQFDSFAEYADNYLYEGLINLAQSLLVSSYGVDAATAQALSPYVADAFAAHYAGDEKPDQATLALIHGYMGSSDASVQYLGQMLYALWTDLEPTDNRALISLDPKIQLKVMGTYASGEFDEGAAEIVAFDAQTGLLFVTNALDNTIDALDITTDPENPSKAFTIDLASYGGGVNSVAVHNGLLAAAVQAEVKQDNGVVVFFNTAGTFLKKVTVGALPDMVTFTPNGKKVLVANEGEPSDNYDIDPEGSVSIIDISRGVRRARVKTAEFKRFNYQKRQLTAKGVRIFGPDATVAQDLEPEYITVSANSALAWVTLQENNAVAVLNVNSGQIIGIYPMGFKAHNLAGNGLDASNKDDLINIDTYDNLFGMYQPDAIGAYQVRGHQFLVTANEGDSRDYNGFSEETTVADVDLDPDQFPNAETLQKKAKLGKLKITSTLGDWDGDGDYDGLYAYGARSFSILSATGSRLAMVFDSGDQLEQLTAAALPFDFNSNNDENDSFDSRSDDKGPEPEGLTIGTINGRTFLFLGLERVSGIMVYDITDPNAPEFVQYLNNRNFDGVAEEGTAGDLGPEGLTFIPAAQSPTGQNMLAVANEISGTTTVYQINVDETAFEKKNKFHGFSWKHCPRKFSAWHR
nr:choice-of-anchor I family protein [uncultured Desulfobacter sp.]